MGALLFRVVVLVSAGGVYKLLIQPRVADWVSVAFWCVWVLALAGAFLGPHAFAKSAPAAGDWDVQLDATGPRPAQAVKLVVELGNALERPSELAEKKVPWMAATAVSLEAADRLVAELERVGASARVINHSS